MIHDPLLARVDIYEDPTGLRAKLKILISTTTFTFLYLEAAGRMT